ncbi:MAG: type II toxin-antitoxin system prevent-host-death family antitoxin [Mariprofundus sp.]
MKAHTAEIIREVGEGKLPYVITQHGEARAIVQNVQEYEHAQKILALLKILTMGEQEISEGKTIAAADVFAEGEKLIDNRQS